MDNSDLLKKWKNRNKTKSIAAEYLRPRPEGSVIPATPGQCRLWLLQQLVPGTHFYQYSHRFDFFGSLDLESLEVCLLNLTKRHELLRCNFKSEGDQVLLFFRDDYCFQLEYLERDDVDRLSDEPAIPPRLEAESTTPLDKPTDSSLSEAEIAFVKRPFDLENDNLFRAAIVRIRPGHLRLLLSLHHIIDDRNGLQILLDELLEEYRTLTKGEGHQIETKRVQFPDFAYDLANRTSENEKVSAFWREYLSGTPSPPTISTDFPRPLEREFKGATVSSILSLSLSESIRALSKEYHCTPNQLWLTVFQIWLYRYGAGEDVWSGSPVSLRTRPELLEMPGFLNETVVYRGHFAENTSLKDLLDQLLPAANRAFSDDIPSFLALISELQPPRGASINPFFQYMLVYNATGMAYDMGADVSLTESVVDLQTAKFDLTLFVTERADQRFALNLEYSTELFKPDTAMEMLAVLEQLTLSLTENPTGPVNSLSILPEELSSKVLQGWNETPNMVPFYQTADLVLRIVRLAKDTPDKLAVHDGLTGLSYGELVKTAGQLAAELNAQRLGAGAIIGIHSTRNVNTLVAILGTLLAGAAYLPLDPTYPADRIAYMLEDAKVNLVIEEPGTISNNYHNTIQTLSFPVINGIGDWPKVPDYQSDQPAYLIYTSGSAGRPKAVIITHGNLTASTQARFTYYEQPPACFLLMSSFSFDSSVAGIYWTLASGGTLLLSPPKIEQDIPRLAAMVKRFSVTHTLLLPSLYQILLEYTDSRLLSCLRVVIVAGEACSPSVVKTHFDSIPDCALYNEYGPTEGTVWATAERVSFARKIEKVGIGKAIPGMKCYVLNNAGKPQPPGVAGELCISGPGLSPGYLRKAELTRQKFFTNPFETSLGYERIYRTGDLVRFDRDSDGRLFFLGRVDQQVKIRGYRVELSEIDHALSLLEDIDEAVVTFKNDPGGEGRLVAYCKSRSKDDIELAVRNSIITLLPAYMRPDVYVFLDEFVRLPNGKIDHHSLPEVSDTQNFDQDSYLPPRGNTEISIASIWERVLKRQSIGRHDNFFQIGGDSLRSIRFVSEAHKAGLKIGAADLFRYQTVSELATIVDQRLNDKTLGDAADNYQAVVPLVEVGKGAPLFCLHSGGGHILFYRDLVNYLDAKRPVYAVQPRGLDGRSELSFDTIEEMADFYLAEIKRIQPSGPYNLLSYCFSNSVLLEITRMLERDGEEIGKLIVVDSAPAHVGPKEEATLNNRPILNFIKHLSAGDFKYLTSRIKKKITLVRWKAETLNNPEKRATINTVLQLNKLYARHVWLPINHHIHFIRSTEFVGRSDKDNQPGQWQALAKKGISEYVVEGKHTELFFEPAVKLLAEKINFIFRED